MEKVIIIISFIFVTMLIAVEPHFMSQPAISPDGEKVCFVYKNDLWTVSFTGGEAQRITSTEAEEWNPKFSPDGKKIAFNSNRDGWTGIYLYALNGEEIKVVNKETLNLLDWFPNSKSLFVRGYETGKGNIFYEVELDGSYKEITSFAGRNADLSKDGNKIIFDRRGNIYRESYTGSYNGDLWVYEIKESKFTRLTETELSEKFPVYSSISNSVYFAASDGNVFQLYKINNGDFEQREQFTKFKKWSARSIAIATSNDRIVFERFDTLWKYDPATEKAEELNIVVAQDCYVNSLEREDVKNTASNYAISDNGKLVVFTYKFDLFAVPEKGGDVRQITHDQSGIEEIQILGDNQTILFTKRTEGQLQLYRVNIKDISNITKLEWSDDKYIDWIMREGKTLAIGFSDDNRKHQVAIADSLCNNIQTIISDQYVPHTLSISPDEKFILYSETLPEEWTQRLYVYNVESKEKEKLYNFNGWISKIFWGKDNKSAFLSENGNIRRADLLARKDFYNEEDTWKDILDPVKEKKEDDKKDKKKEVKDEKKKDSLKIDTEGFSDRITTIITKPGNSWIAHVIDDSTFYYVNYNNKKYSLRKADFTGENDKLITSLSTVPEDLKFNEKNKVFYYILKEKLYKYTPKKGKKAELIEMDYKYSYDRFQLNNDVFQQVWVEFGKGFYDPDMHGVNWKRSKKDFSKYLQFANTPDILKKIIDEMIGEVNASHTGFYPRSDSNYKTYDTAYCGFEFDYKNFPKNGIRIKKIYKKSKLNKPHNIKAGDILLSVDGEEIGQEMDIIANFKNKVGEKIKLEIMCGDSMKVVTIKGLSNREDRALFYDNWVEERRIRVEKLSGGKIGYLHIRSMNNTSYQKFIQDLFAENADKKALIIDVRNNGGGYIHDRLLEILTKKPYALSTYRGYDGKVKYKNPDNTVDVPMALLINENSFSDAEIFPTLFKQLELGIVIGMPTSGSVIGTGHYTFMDGSSMRMPSTGWYTPTGKNMEGNGAIPDIFVDPTPEQIINDDDVQLKRAVEELLKKF
ncbi:MAG: S41 family peptidase [Candidatus Tenebribacter burtonii]|nr:S41 family peptidase [Candidatus Tenebribacter burtonii]